MKIGIFCPKGQIYLSDDLKSKYFDFTITKIDKGNNKESQIFSTLSNLNWVFKQGANKYRL